MLKYYITYVKVPELLSPLK